MKYYQTNPFRKTLDLPANKEDSPLFASNFNKKTNPFWPGPKHATIAFSSSGASKISMHWQTKAIQLRRANP
jgi:hypothetical protein